MREYFDIENTGTEDKVRFKTERENIRKKKQINSMENIEK
jgi:hypothetical protein